MPFVTYENRADRHVTIHSHECKQIRKRGGEHKHGQGGYHEHSTYQAAEEYATNTGLPIVRCSFCNPQTRASM